MEQQSRMSSVPPTVRTAVAVAVFCEAGRRLAHPTRPGWERPCMEPGVRNFVVSEENGSRSVRKLCVRHMAELDADGLTL